MIVTELITNNAAGVMMFPIALSVAEAANYMPFVIAIMVGASAGFITPIGYQTNLMVYGPGGYPDSWTSCVSPAVEHPLRDHHHRHRPARPC